MGDEANPHSVDKIVLRALEYTFECATDPERTVYPTLEFHYSITRDLPVLLVSLKLKYRGEVSHSGGLQPNSARYSTAT